VSIPPRRIQTERLVLRCWEPDDAPLLKATIDKNVEHLLPWMPWAAHEPETLAEKTARLAEFKRLFGAGDEAVYAIFNRAETEVLGGTGLHPRGGAHGREIGYWIAAEHEGKGLVTESSAVLTRVGFEHLELDRMEIHCDPRNVRSAAIPRRLGYEHEATLRRRLTDHLGDFRDEMIWTLFRDRFAGSPATAYPYTATP
jgi:RimJ/RimL family protein N-acetyltransferase